MRQGDVSPSPALILFKPRQILLAQIQQQRNSVETSPMAITRPENPTQLKPEDESILTYSIAVWLKNKGLSKVLKRFLSATQIQGDDWKAKALNLNEIFSKYQETSNDVTDVKKASKELSEKNIDELTVDESGMKSKDENKNVGDLTVDESAKKPKDKKKKKSIPDLESPNATEKPIAVISEVTEEKNISKCTDNKDASEVIVEIKKKKKEKKPKKDDLLDVNKVITDKDTNVIESKEDKVQDEETTKKKSIKSAEDEAKDTKKGSKKRKRLATDENENQPAQEVEVEESKRKKTKALEPQSAPPAANEHAQQAKESDETAINNNGVENSSQKKSAKKQNGTAEPKTVNAFQRVKVDEVVFTDERLQDNSYWAKNGAENGYGAKAQEVLGQVKGRGFRHEKTKKKRGSYRGGQIDLESHSIKFENSDEE